MEEINKFKILFLCTGNSCRSQMAEGFTRHLKGDVIEAYSAGTEPQGLNRLAVRAMNEVGIDIGINESKQVKSLAGIDFDYVVTVCGHANENCPIFPGTVKVIHRGFEDPPRLAENAKDDEEALYFYRKVRDEIKDFIESLPEALRQ